MRRVNLQQALEKGIEQGARNIFLFAGFPPPGNTGKLSRLAEYELGENDVEEIFKSTASSWQLERFKKQKEIDYSYGIEKIGRFMVCVFSNMGKTAMVMRLMPPEVPRFEVLNLADVLRNLPVCATASFSLRDLRDALMTASIVEYIRQPSEGV